MIVMGIETSCDETAIAILDDCKRVYAHTLLSQIESHKKYGGVVPELASRNHLSSIYDVYKSTLNSASLKIEDIDTLSVTAGPGLIGGLLVGVMFAKGLSIAANKPIIGVNHLEGHALTVRFCQDLPFPYLMLLVSGGHCQILEVLGVGNYKLVGKTLDDAVGESFDKVAKMLALPYPGGPIIEKLAKLGDPKSIKFPASILKSSPFDFSFSGLKTAVKRYIEANNLNDNLVANICASFQATVSTVLCNRLRSAANQFAKKYPNSKNIVIAGGVAANQYIKINIQNALPDFNIITPPVNLCTDNGIMIAWAGVERAKHDLFDDLAFEPRSRWPLDQRTQEIIP